ncbi:uncharacterized protein LOC123551437 [Mercenaria mercenaria]|uniref:uncharacterized protein LOC123551437 n=1 Tax=Mercenaria mercenaria TaxID=6596 RepID=UPI00234E8F36|nr:uncharacterized protein LOC123551437 [Mercenaria mercenaria]
MLKHFPFDDPVLQDSSFLVPTSWEEIEQDAVVRLGRRFPGIIHPEDLDQLEEEYGDLQVLRSNVLPEYDEHTKLDEYWGKLASMRNKITGKSRFPTLTRLACALLTIPNSNADCERTFSCVRKVQTELRSDLDSTTITALLSCKIIRDRKCYDLNISDDLRLQSKKATHKYNKELCK